MGKPRLLQGGGGPWPHVLLLQHPAAQRGDHEERRAAQRSSHHLQMLPPCLGGMSIIERAGRLLREPLVSPQWDTTSHGQMDTCTAKASHTAPSLRFTPQLSLKGTGKGLANTGFLSP